MLEFRSLSALTFAAVYDVQHSISSRTLQTKLWRASMRSGSSKQTASFVICPIFDRYLPSTADHDAVG